MNITLNASPIARVRAILVSTETSTSQPTMANDVVICVLENSSLKSNVFITQKYLLSTWNIQICIWTAAICWKLQNALLDS